MTDTVWTWAMLDRKGVQLVREAEETIGAEVVLVYAEGGPRAEESLRADLKPATLDASQLECLQGMEQAIGGVAVAYQRA